MWGTRLACHAIGLRAEDVAPDGKRDLKTLCGGGAIFNIVGLTDIPVGSVLRANNVEGGSAREVRAESHAAG